MISMSHRLNSMFCPNCFVCALLRFLTLRGSSLMRRLQSRRSPLHVAAICLLSALAVGGCLEGCERRPSPSTAAQAFSRPASVPSSAIRFDSVARQAGIDFAPSRGGRSPLTILETAGGGCAFLDYDNDGWPDLLVVNGHAFPEVDHLNTDIRYRERAVLYRNQEGKFSDVSETSGAGIREAHAARGAGFGDYDNDGQVEVVVNNQNEAPTLLRQVTKTANHWITLKLEGTRANRSAIGARVRVVAGALTQTGEVRSGGSYLSQSDLRLHFGLGRNAKVDRVEIVWPGGVKQQEVTVAVDRVTTIRQK